MMNRTASLLSVLLMLLFASQLATPRTASATLDGSAGDLQVLIWAETSSVTAELARWNPQPVTRLGTLALVLVDAEASRGLPVDEIADPLPFSAPTYLVTGPERLLEPRPAGLERLHRAPREAWWLARGTHEAIQALAARGLSVIRLERPGAHPVPLAVSPAPSGEPEGGGLREVNPAILAIVLQASVAEMTQTVQRLQDFGTRYSYTDSCAAATQYLYDRFSAYGLATELQQFDLQGTPVNNVIATQLGSTHPDETYIICGHYDSISQIPEISAPGADDNGSGSAAVVEAARLLSQHEFEATIVYICFCGEEQGLIGSQAYVQEIVVPMGMDLRGVINLDMIAYVHPDYPNWDANIYADTQVSQALGEHLAGCLNDYTVCLDELILTGQPQYGSDHYWFAQYGYPAVFGIDAQLWGAPDWNPHYHSPEDLIDTLDLFYLTDFTRGAIACLAELAVLDDQVGIAEAEPAAGVPVLVRIAPNPFAERVAFQVPGGALRVLVADAGGRVVKELTGERRIEWDGRDASGRRLASGTYFYRIVEPRHGGTGRLVIVR